MTSQAQILANQRNAQKSTGPRTQQGKTSASQNSVKHGLTARSSVIAAESEDEFNLHRRQIFDELNPASPMESLLADRIITLSWRLKRICKIQNQTVDVLNAKNAFDPLAKLTKSLSFNLPGKPRTDIDINELALGRLAVKDFANSRVLDRLLMYERRMENSLYKTILEFQRLNLAKKIKAEI